MSFQLADGVYARTRWCDFCTFHLWFYDFFRIYNIWKETAAEPPLTPKIAISQQNIFAISLWIRHSYHLSPFRYLKKTSLILEYDTKIFPILSRALHTPLSELFLFEISCNLFIFHRIMKIIYFTSMETALKRKLNII